MLEYGDDSSRFVKKIVSYLSVLVSIVLLFASLIIKEHFSFFDDGVREAAGLLFSELHIGICPINVVYIVVLVLFVVSCVIKPRVVLCSYFRIVCIVALIILEFLYMRDPAEFSITETTLWFWICITMYLISVITNACFIFIRHREK